MKFTGLKKVVSAVLAAAVLVMPVVARAGYAPERPTYTYGPNFVGADHVQFNSIVNNPGYGDERTFFDGRDASITTPGQGWSDPINNVQAGKEYKLRIFVHNNANQSLNASGKGVAKDTKVKVALPAEAGTNLVAVAGISASNAQPQTVTDTLNFKSGSNVALSYVPGSAYVTTAKLNKVKISDDIVKGGATVGSDAINGNWLGCFGSAGWVYLTVKANAPVQPKPGLTIVKSVEKPGGSHNQTSMTVAPGDKVEYAITVTNTGKTDLQNVTVRDAMPAGVTVNGATLVKEVDIAQAITNYKQLFTSEGLNIGTIKVGKNAVVLVSATVNQDATGKDCAATLPNTAYASATGVPSQSASATVQVNKTCTQTPSQPLPETGAEGAAAGALGLTAVGTSVRAYIRSKRGLVAAARKTNR